MSTARFAGRAHGGPAPGGDTGAPALDAVFAALADPTRRAMLDRLTAGEATVGELAEPFTLSQPAVTKHLKVLERAGLVTRTRSAQRRPARLNPEQLRRATECLERYRLTWEENYARLDRVLAESSEGDESPARPGGRAATSNKTSSRTDKKKGDP